MSLRYFSSTAGQMVLQSSISSSATSITVDTVTGLPGAEPFTIVLDPGTSLEEICDVTAVAGTTLTITRGVDGSPAVAHSTGAFIRHMFSARDLREANTHVNATSAVHGVVGALVGTTDTQALTNKDLTNSTNTFPSSLATSAALSAHTSASGGVHGVAGSVVGTTDIQTLTNKTINAPVVNNPTLNSPTVTGTITGNGAFTGSVSGTTGSFSGAVTGTNLPSLMQAGQVSITLPVSANNVSQALNFPVAFSGTPVVVVSLSNLPGGSSKATVRTVATSPTGTTLWVENGDGTNFGIGVTVTVDWVAMH